MKKLLLIIFTLCSFGVISCSYLSDGETITVTIKNEEEDLLLEDETNENQTVDSGELESEKTEDSETLSTDGEKVDSTKDEDSENDEKTTESAVTDQTGESSNTDEEKTDTEKQAGETSETDSVVEVDTASDDSNKSNKESADTEIDTAAENTVDDAAESSDGDDGENTESETVENLSDKEAEADSVSEADGAEVADTNSDDGDGVTETSIDVGENAPENAAENTVDEQDENEDVETSESSADDISKETDEDSHQETEIIDTDPILQPSEIPDETPPMTDIINDSQVIIKERQWSILLYMCGDNNLESAAITDLLEMERSKIDTDVVSVFALVDRNDGYVTSNDNWTGTRLYKIKTGAGQNSTELISERIECKNLGLTTSTDTELDMSSNTVLSGAMSYVMERFPADHYGLIVWGHGTGWRGEADSQISNDMSSISAWKGFAYDETSGTYMTLNQFGNGLKNSLGKTPIDFIGFDTCYGGEVEIMYEIKDYAHYGIGSEGLVESNGWNYEKLFNFFSDYDELSPENFCNAVVRQFKDSYQNLNRSSIAVVDMNAVNDYVLAFNNYCAAVAGKISTLDIHDGVMGVLYDNENCSTEKYTYGKSGYDIYLDVNSVVENLQKYFVSIKSSTDLINLYSIFKNTAGSVYYSTWASDRTTGGLGVYFSTLTQGNYLSSTHPSAYISGKTYNQINFVKNCIGYVPAATDGSGLLDKLFYTSFN